MGERAKRVQWKKRILLFKQGKIDETGVNDGTANDKEGRGANAEMRILAAMMVIIDKAFLSNKEGNTSVSWRIDDLPKEEFHISRPTFVEPKVGRISMAIICIRNEEMVSKITHVTPLPKKEWASS
ncbi:uncharacterized protein ARMOST_21294 [Armillaria ostoyae]|uniref:Uncharacterized protein n=1 Tax=Armillaria ostoyae TaxID=47428 RepID=A0A284S9P6_ARMOS|nr:uncharacterized protein ARMOST_21294 [Armillaria ostoyae]